MLWGGVGILAAFMVSVSVYKLWYILAASVIFFTVLLSRPSNRWFKVAFVDLTPIGLYCIAAALSLFLSSAPDVGRYFLLADAIFPALTVLFYAVGVASKPIEIVRAFRFLVPLAALATAITWGSVPGREGYRVAFILPYVIPFLFVGGASYLHAVSALAIIFVTRSRVPTVSGFALAALTPLAMGQPRKLHLPRLIIGAAGLFGVALFVPATRIIIIQVLARFIGQPVSFAGASFVPQSYDPTREKLSILSSELAGPSWFGVGYGNFGIYYAERFSDDQQTAASLHSVYEALWVETGVVGFASALIMISYVLLRLYQGYQSAQSSLDRHYFLGLTLSSGAILFAALFHQMHQTPMLFVIMGLSLGSFRRLMNLESQLDGR